MSPVEFTEIGEAIVPTSKQDQGRIITSVMRSGGRYRQFLQTHGVELATDDWVGLPGAEVAATILAQVVETVDSINPIGARETTLRTEAVHSLGRLGVGIVE